MIERYALYDIDKLRDLYGLTNGVPKGVKSHYNIQPAQQVPVVFKRGSETLLEMMQWGFVPQNAKDTNSIFRYKTHAVRSEDVFKKVMWERAIRTQRCLVPINGFFVFTPTEGGKTPYYVEVKNQPVASLAGIYSSWTDPAGIEHSMVSVVTAPSNEETHELTDRLPVIVQPHQQSSWLDPSNDQFSNLYDVMRMPADSSLSIRQVGEGIFSKKTDNESLIKER